MLDGVHSKVLGVVRLSGIESGMVGSSSVQGRVGLGKGGWGVSAVVQSFQLGEEVGVYTTV